MSIFLVVIKFFKKIMLHHIVQKLPWLHVKMPNCDVSMIRTKRCPYQELEGYVKDVWHDISPDYYKKLID
ncbi:hypothetical protein C1646_382466, partial [Rhizophagus diaphanus]